jgi:hypothetical protein
MVKQLLDGKLGGRTGRPRLRWLDDVEADMTTMGIKRWRLIAKYRTEWAGIIREAKALQGPQSQREEEVSKNESRLIKLSVCLSVCPPLITLESLGRYDLNAWLA